MAFDALYTLDAAPFDGGKEGVVVYGATRGLDGERVAVKVFALPTLPRREGEVREAIDKEFLLREMLRRRAAPLPDHPHLVPSLGLFYVDPPPPRKGVDSVRAMLVMGLARGKSAEHRLQGGGYEVQGSGGGGGGGGIPPVNHLFSPAETVSVAFCLASALAHLHANGVLHNDVKPANTLFFDGDAVPPRARSARLADFGESHIMSIGGSTTSFKKGTEAYMAPELLHNERLVRARCKEGADIWSLGATLLALLTGLELGRNDELQERLADNVQLLKNGTLEDWGRKEFFAVDSLELTPEERVAWAAAPLPLRELIVDCFALAPEKRPSAQQLLETPLLAAERAEVERVHAMEEAVAPLKEELRALKEELRALKEENSAQKEELPTAQLPPARVVELMNAGAGDARVLAAGARALVELTGGEGLFAARGAALAARGANHEARCAECVGAVLLLVRALDSPPAECAVACLALRNIASFDAQRDACAAAGAIPALVGALTRHSGEAGVCEGQVLSLDVCQTASAALWNIALASDAHRDACAAAGAIPALVGALTRHAGEAGVCEDASSALGSIAAGSDAHRNACAAAGAIPALVGALTRHAGEAVVCQNASGALQNITSTSEIGRASCRERV